MINYYAQRATEHDLIYEIPERQADIIQLHELCRVKFADLDVLEVSCGTGYWTQFMASTAKSITACDINDAVLQIAKKREWKGAKVDFHQADSYDLPDFKQQFNAAFSGFWWSHIPRNKLSEYLAGFHKPLASGALVVFIDNRFIEGSSTPISRIDENGDSFQIRKISSGSTYEVLKNFPTKEELVAILSDVAFDIEITLLDYYWILSYRKK